MVFSPLFEEVAESEVIDKIMVVVHRDMKEALDHWYASDNLPDFAVMTEDDQDEFSYPLLVLSVEAGTSEESISGEFLDQELVVGASMAIAGTSVKDVTRKAKKYLRALKAVLRKGVLEILPDADQYTTYAISFRHQYLRYKNEGERFIQPVEMIIRLRCGEV